jgi:ribosomal protein L7/L12
MTGTFNCPACGAPLDYPERVETMRCPYCNNSVIVPEELRTQAPPVSISQIGETLNPNRFIQQSDKLKEVALLAHNGKEIEAIKLYRQITGCGLQEAKAAVDNLQAGSPSPLNPTMNQTQVYGSLSSLQIAEIKQLMQSGQKIEAIKRYRQITGTGLKEAKDTVEAMAAGLQPKKMADSGSRIKSKIIGFVCGLFLLGIASIFPIGFIPMGILSWQENDMGGAIGAFLGAGIWAFVWGGIGCLIIYFSLAKID